MQREILRASAPKLCLETPRPIPPHSAVHLHQRVAVLGVPRPRLSQPLANLEHGDAPAVGSVEVRQPPSEVIV